MTSQHAKIDEPIPCELAPSHAHFLWRIDVCKPSQHSAAAEEPAHRSRLVSNEHAHDVDEQLVVDAIEACGRHIVRHAEQSRQREIRPHFTTPSWNLIS